MFCFRKKPIKKPPNYANLNALSKLYVETECSLVEIGYMDFDTKRNGSIIKRFLNLIMILNNAKRNEVEATLENVCYYIYSIAVESQEELRSTGISAVLSRLCGFVGGGVVFKQLYIEKLLKTPFIEFQDRLFYHEFVKFCTQSICPHRDYLDVIDLDFDIPEQTLFVSFLSVAIFETEILFDKTKRNDFNIQNSVYFNTSVFPPINLLFDLPNVFNTVYIGSRALWTIIKIFTGHIVSTDLLFVRDNYYEYFNNFQLNIDELSILNFNKLKSSSALLKYDFKLKKTVFASIDHQQLYKIVKACVSQVVKMELWCECFVFFKIEKFFQEDSLI